MNVAATLNWIDQGPNHANKVTNFLHFEGHSDIIQVS